MIINYINSHHRKFVVKWRIISIISVMINIIIVASIYIFNYDEFIFRITIFALFSSILVMIYGLMMIIGRPYCILMPYFERKICHNCNTYASGSNLAKIIDDLDNRLSSNGLVIIGNLISPDSYKNNKNQWHDATVGITSVDWILDNCEMKSQAKEEINNIRSALIIAKDNNVKFCFHQKFIDGTNSMEHEQRQGSYF